MCVSVYVVCVCVVSECVRACACTCFASQLWNPRVMESYSS